MKRAAAAKIPREVTRPAITRPCPACHGEGTVTVLDGRHFRKLRELSGVTLTEMARICDVSRPHLSRMERGEQTFQPRFADLYQRLFDRRQKSGDES